MLVKGLVLGALVDNALRMGYKGAKAIIVPLAKGFTDATGQKFGEEAIGKIVSLLPATEQDEQMIDDAMPFLKDNEQLAWFDFMDSFNPVPVAETDEGYSEYLRKLNEAMKLKEYYRKLTCKDTPQATADKMRRDAGMSETFREAYFRSLDIERKALQSKFQPFIIWAELNGKSLLERALENRTEVNTILTKSADGVDNWVDNFLGSRGSRW